MFGRTEELAVVSELLQSNRLVTVVGPGGVGKTTLAKEVAEASGLPALLARLGPLGGHDLQEELAGQLGFRSWDQLEDDLERRKRLLILDNAEHLVGPLADLVENSLSGFESLAVLVTSREPLGLPDERVYPLQPMSLAGRPSEAARMFLWFTESRGLQPPDNLDELEAMCADLDGLPLALELAAGLASTLTPAEIRSAVETRLDLLTRARPRRSERLSSLDATIAWSMDLLDDRSRRFLEAVSILEGAFPVDLAAGIAGLDRGVDAVGLLHGLVERSLLVHDASGDRSWYAMLNTIRAHCRERLAREGRDEDLRERLVDVVADACTQLSKTDIHDTQVPNDVGRLFHNIRAAVSWCIDNDPDPDRVRRIVPPLYWLEDVGHQAEAADLLGRVLARWPSMADTDGVTLGVLANLQRVAGRLGDARDNATRALELGDDRGQVVAHHVLGILDRQSGRPESAKDHFRAGSEAAAAIGWPGHAAALRAHGALATAAAGDIDTALDQLHRIEEESREYPLPHRVVQLFRSHLLLHRDPDAAGALAGEILERATRDHHTWAIGTAAYQQAVAAWLANDEARAAESLATALRAFDSARIPVELHQTLLVARALLDHEGLTAEAEMARAGLSALPERQISPVDMALLSRLGVDTEPQPDTGRTFDIEIVVAGLRQIAEHGPPPTTGTITVDSNKFAPRGEVWEIAFGGRTTYVRDSKGMEDLGHLLARPGREIAAVDLMQAGVVESGTGPTLDDTARSRYEERIRELQAEVDEAESANDPYRAERATAELDRLVEQLTSAYGLGGRTRTSGDTGERARSAVTWRIRAAIDRIRENHPTLADHLDRSVRTGRFCAYEPDGPISWET